MLEMMKRHPFLCYAGLCGEHAGYSDMSFIWNFVKYESLEYFQAIKKAITTAIYLPYTKAKIFFAKRDKCIKSIKLYDFEKENPGWSTSYLYQVQITFSEDSTEEEEVKWLRKWFRKREYGKYGYYHSVIEVDYLQKEGLEGVYSYSDLWK